MASKASTSPRRSKHLSSTHLITDRALVSRWSRSELEDKYLTLCDEHMQTKILLNEKEKTITKLQAQLVKSRKGQGEHSVSPNRDDSLAALQARLIELDKQNMLLKDKLKSANYQLKAYAQWPLSPYYLRSRPNSSRSRPKTPHVPPSLPDRTSLHPSVVVEPSHHHPSPIADNTMVVGLQEKVLSVETTNFHLQEQIRIYELEIASLKEELKKKQADFVIEYDLLKKQIMNNQKYTVQENIEIIHLQKLLREKSNELALLQAKFSKTEMDFRAIKSTYDQILIELDQSTIKIRTEQTMNSQLQNELRLLQSSNTGTLITLKQEVDSLKRENEVLEESNKKLTASAFNTEREKQWETTEKTLRSQISQLEATIKADVNIRGELLEKLAMELTSKDDLEQQLRKLEVVTLQQKAELERMQQKLDRVTVGQNIQYEELVEVISVIRQRKQITYTDNPVEFPEGLLPLPGPLPGPNLDDKYHQLELGYAETVQELEKMRNMLLIQHKINRDYQAEVDEVSKRAEQNKSDYERKIKEYAEMLDQRALRIQRLEKQLHDIAYGTRPYKTVPGAPPSDKDLALEGGQNILELHITKLSLTDHGLKYMQSVEPTTFLTIEFFDFEIEFTPMLRGAGPQMDFTCQYTVTVNDLFLHYIQTESLMMELHQAIATHYKTWAAGHVDLKDLLNKPDGKVVGSMHLLGISPESVGITFGKVEFSAQLKVPVDQALRLYKERIKALGYIVANREERQDVETTALVTAQNTNQLHIYIHRCHNLKSKIPGTVPSAYAVYQFFDFPDHDSMIVNENANPDFGDHMCYPVVMNRLSDQYLRSQSLRVYIFDDAAPNDDLAYVGHVDVPLLPLAHNKPIMGTFEVRTTNELVSGTIDVSLNWQFAYIPSPDSMFIAEPLINLPPIPPEIADSGVSKATEGLDEIPVHLVQAKRKIDETVIQQGPMVIPAGPSGGEVLIDETENRTVIQIERLIVPDKPQIASSIPAAVAQQVLPVPASLPIAIAQAALPIADKRPEVEKPSQQATIVVPVPAEVDVVPSKPLEEDSKLDEYNLRKTEDPTIPTKLPPFAPPRKLKQGSPPESETSASAGLKPEEPIVTQVSDDDDDVIVTSPPSGAGKYIPPIVIGVRSLWLPEDSPLLTIENISKLFIEWRFLDLPPEESETPESLPKPTVAGHRINFNFLKTVRMDPGRYPARGKKLLEMLANGEPLIFELVSEPSDQGDCEELGTATVSLNDIEKSGKDPDNEMFDVLDDNAKVIAYIHISLTIVETINSLKNT